MQTNGKIFACLKNYISKISFLFSFKRFVRLTCHAEKATRPVHTLNIYFIYASTCPVQTCLPSVCPSANAKCKKTWLFEEVKYVLNSNFKNTLLRQICNRPNPFFEHHAPCGHFVRCQVYKSKSKLASALQF